MGTGEKEKFFLSQHEVTVLVRGVGMKRGYFLLFIGITFLSVLQCSAETVDDEVSVMGVPPNVATIGDREITAGFSREGKLVSFFYPTVGAYDFVPYWTTTDENAPYYGAPGHLGGSLGIVDFFPNPEQPSTSLGLVQWLTGPDMRPAIDHKWSMPAFDFRYWLTDTAFDIPGFGTVYGDFDDFSVTTTVFSPVIDNKKQHSVVYSCRITNNGDEDREIGIAYYALFDPSKKNQNPYVYLKNPLSVPNVGAQAVLFGETGWKKKQGTTHVDYNDGMMVWSNENYAIGFSSNLKNILYSDVKDASIRRNDIVVNPDARGVFGDVIENLGQTSNIEWDTPDDANGIVIWKLTVPRHGSKNFRVVVSAGDTRSETEATLANIRQQPVKDLVTSTESWWRANFLKKLENQDFYPKMTAKEKRYLKWWVMTMALMADERTGAIIASPMLIPQYYGSWPRDGTYQAIVWTRLGFTWIAKKYYRYLLNIYQEEGSWYQCYDSEGSEYVGFKWPGHLITTDTVPDFGIYNKKIREEDQMSLVMLGLWYYKERTLHLPVDKTDVRQLADYIVNSVEPGDSDRPAKVRINYVDILNPAMNLVDYDWGYYDLELGSVKHGLIRPSSDAYEFPGEVSSDLLNIPSALVSNPRLIAARQSSYTNFAGISALDAAYDVLEDEKYRTAACLLKQHTESVFSNQTEDGERYFTSAWNPFMARFYDRPQDNSTTLAWPLQSYSWQDPVLQSHCNVMAGSLGKQQTGENDYFFAPGLLMIDIYENIVNNETKSGYFNRVLQNAVDSGDINNGYIPEKVAATGSPLYRKLDSAEPLGWSHAVGIMALVTKYEGAKKIPILPHGCGISIEWQKTFGGSSEDKSYYIGQTGDGGYVLTGETNSTDGNVTGKKGNHDLWIVKLTPSGGISWQKCLGGSSWDFGRSINQTADGGYILTGYTYSKDGDVTSPRFPWSADLWVVKVNPAGGIEWQKCYGGIEYDCGYEIKPTADGGYILIGTTFSGFDDEVAIWGGDMTGHHGDNPNLDIWVAKLNSTGGIVWQRCFGGSDEDTGECIQQTSDGGYIFIGGTESSDGNVTGAKGEGDVWVVKLTPAGNIKWQKCFGGSSGDYGRSIEQTPDGGYIFTGGTASTDGDVVGNGSGNAWVVKIDANGNIKWKQCLGDSLLWESGESIRQVADGSSIFLGSVRENRGGRYNRDVWVAKLGPSGTIMSQIVIGGSEDDFGERIIPTSDGRYIVTGYTYSDDYDVSNYQGEIDVWVVKLR